MWLENRHVKNNFILESLDGKFTYRVFIRYSSEFIEDFSVGLIWTNAAQHININRDIILLRCQGPHDSGEPVGSNIHCDYHIHQTTVKDVLEQRYSKPENKCVTDAFSSFQTALFYFASFCGIINTSDYQDFTSNAFIQLSFQDLNQ